MNSQTDKGNSARCLVVTKDVIAYGQPITIGCDQNCKKAWGINSRPKIKLSDDEDDYAFLSDSELGEAPDDPGTYEGFQAKPQRPEDLLNKWCFRECERSCSAKRGEKLKFPNFEERVYNIPRNAEVARIDEGDSGQ